MPKFFQTSLFIRSSLVAVVATILGIVVGLVVVIFSDLPQVSELEHFEPKGVTVLKDVKGQTIQEIYTERRVPLRFENIPEKVRLAFLATEDWRFYSHVGIDFQGMARAMVKNIFEGRYAEGASTITQQLSRVLFLTTEKTLARKFKEALLSLQIERKYSKNEILTLYLNQIYLGSGCYGIETAAQIYFGKKISEVSIPEMAMLAGLPQAPSRLSPFIDPEAALKRRNTVLELMLERKIISKPEFLQAKETPIPTKPANEDRLQSYFGSFVLAELVNELGETAVFKGHLEVDTTLDLSLQQAAELAVKNGMEAFTKRHKVKAAEPDKIPQVALLAMDIRSGEIRAMVGGRSFVESPFNRATQALRQPGSAIKPIIYAAGMERGYTQSRIFDDTAIKFQNRQSGNWEPKNYDRKYMGPIPLRVALEQSKNMVAIRLLQAIGVPTFQKMALRLGITSPVASNLTSALGSSSVHLTELARAFAVFGNGGIRPNIRAIRSVQKTHSKYNLWPPPLPSQVVMDPQVAYVMTDLLSGVIKNGTGVFAKDLPCAVAGKTGTTDDNIDSIFVGFNSNLIVVTWMGFDDRKTLGHGETGAVAAGPIWKEFMETACSDAHEMFLPPVGVLLVDVDHSTGKLPGRLCDDIQTEAFINGTEPKEICNEEELSQF